MAEQDWLRPVTPGEAQGSAWSARPQAQFELRPLSLGEVLDRIFGLYRSRFWLFAGISMIAASVNAIGQAVSLAAAHRLANNVPAAPNLTMGAALGNLRTVGAANAGAYVVMLIFVLVSAGHTGGHGPGGDAGLPPAAHGRQRGSTRGAAAVVPMDRHRALAGLEPALGAARGAGAGCSVAGLCGPFQRRGAYRYRRGSTLCGRFWWLSCGGDPVSAQCAGGTGGGDGRSCHPAGDAAEQSAGRGGPRDVFLWCCSLQGACSRLWPCCKCRSAG